MRWVSTITAFIALNVTFNTIWAEIIHVPGDRPTIQLGINIADDGDTVLISSGIYYENINFLGKAIVIMSEGGPEATIIDGGDVARVVTFQNEEDSNSVIQGFSIQNGYATYEQNGLGGGIYCYGVEPTPNVKTKIDMS